MADLLFFEDSHEYLLEGEKLPCVTDLLRFLHREIYSAVPKGQMEAAALRGTAVHAAAEALDRAGTAEIDDAYLPYLQAYLAFLRDHAVSWQLIEHPDYHPEDCYAGTVDRYGTVDGEEAIVDFKASYAVQKPLCGAQLNLYRRMLQARGRSVKRLYILHLRRDGTYKLLPFPIDDTVPDALLTLHRATQKRRRKKSCPKN